MASRAVMDLNCPDVLWEVLFFVVEVIDRFSQHRDYALSVCAVAFDQLHDLDNTYLAGMFLHIFCLICSQLDTLTDTVLGEELKTRHANLIIG